MDSISKCVKNNGEYDMWLTLYISNTSKCENATKLYNQMPPMRLSGADEKSEKKQKKKQIQNDFPIILLIGILSYVCA